MNRGALVVGAIAAAMLAGCGGATRPATTEPQPLPPLETAAADDAGAEPASPAPPVVKGPPIDIETARPLVVRYSDLMRELNDGLDEIIACPDAGQYLQTWSTEHLAEIDTLEQQIGRLDEDQTEALRPELTALGAESMRTSRQIDRCVGDPAFAAAVKTAFAKP